MNVLVAVLKLLGAGLKHCSKLEASGSCLWASSRSPETCGSCHKAVGCSPDASGSSFEDFSSSPDSSRRSSDFFSSIFKASGSCPYLRVDPLMSFLRSK